MNEDSSILWHKQLDHISREMMELLIKDESLTSFDFFFFKIFVLNALKENTLRLRKKMS